MQVQTLIFFANSHGLCVCIRAQFASYDDAGPVSPTPQNRCARKASRVLTPLHTGCSLQDGGDMIGSRKLEHERALAHVALLVRAAFAGNTRRSDSAIELCCTSLDEALRLPKTLLHQYCTASPSKFFVVILPTTAYCKVSGPQDLLLCTRPSLHHIRHDCVVVS